jgi:hypothetical protein
VAAVARAAATDPWVFSLYRPGQAITTDGSLGDPAGVQVAGAALQQLASFQACAADGATSGVTTASSLVAYSMSAVCASLARRSAAFGWC